MLSTSQSMITFCITRIEDVITREAKYNVTFVDSAKDLHFIALLAN